jgi:succinate dehydrogenase / fumarate reductase cytochrome b subunit
VSKRRVVDRPVNLDLFSIKLPVMSVASILHRISGFALFFAIALLLWSLDRSLSSPAGFQAVVDCLSHPFSKFVLWAILSALAYHVVAGCKHLLMDLGIGESLEGGKLGAQITLAVSALIIIGLGVWVW